MSSPVTHGQSLSYTPYLAHILGSCAFISVVSPFVQFIQIPSCNGIPPLSWCISPLSTGGRSEGTQEPRKNGHVKLNHLHMHQDYPLVPIFRTSSCGLHSHPSAALRPPSHLTLVYPVSPTTYFCYHHPST